MQQFKNMSLIFIASFNDMVSRKNKIKSQIKILPPPPPVWSKPLNPNIFFENREDKKLSLGKMLNSIFECIFLTARNAFNVYIKENNLAVFNKKNLENI